MRLQEISAERYGREVLPLTAPLWAARRTFDEYVAQTLELARSRYGRRHYRTIGLYDGSKLVASFKRYERTLHHSRRNIEAIGFGAVFTPLEYRGRGYASIMLATSLDAARTEGYGVAYLFSDIRPQFYSELGFRALPSRELTLRADALWPRRLSITTLESKDWNGIRRCFDQCERRRHAGFSRSSSVWEWIATRTRHGFVARAGRAVRAYAFGVRAPERDAYVLDEYGVADNAPASTVPALLRAAAGDLRRVIGWLPPDGARDLLPKGATRKRNRAIFMMAPLSDDGRQLIETISANSSGDFCWATDHI
jgi:predicted N-acetyltransferase YhbS